MPDDTKADDKVEAEEREELLFNMDEAKRARHEKLGTPKAFVFEGVRYELPLEAPYSFAEKLAMGDYRGSLAELVDGQADGFFDSAPTVQDLEGLIEYLTKVYAGVSAGESGASGGSSRKTGRSSRPRSQGSTRKT